MNRRAFLRAAPATGAAAAALTSALIAPDARAWDVPATPPRPRYHVLGPAPVDSAQRVVKQLSDDVFERLIADLAGRKSFVQTDAQYLGEFGMREMLQQACTLSPCHAGDRPIDLNVTDFRERSAGWHVHQGGTEAVFDSPGIATWVAFADVTRVGMLQLPNGVHWAANYLDEVSGVAMRAVSIWEIWTDNIKVRWDVIVG